MEHEDAKRAKDTKREGREGEARAGWDEQFAAMAGAGDDRLLDGDRSSPAATWDQDEWEW
jgi:hypothetical protein